MKWANKKPMRVVLDTNVLISALLFFMALDKRLLAELRYG